MQITIKDTHGKLCDEFSVVNVSVRTADATEGDYMRPMMVMRGREGGLKSVKSDDVEIKRLVRYP